MDISIVMPALNEKLLIAQTLAATRQLVGDAEVIVWRAAAATAALFYRLSYRPLRSPSTMRYTLGRS